MHAILWFPFDAINRNDTVAQIARCSFDVHVLEIIGTIIIGGTLIMLHPGGIIDFDYFISMYYRKNKITYIQAVPSLLRAFFNFFVKTMPVYLIPHV